MLQCRTIMEETSTSMSENKKTINPVIVIVGGVLLLSVLVFLFFMNSRKVSQPTGETPTLNQVETSVEASGAVKEFSVDGSSFEFDPKTITVKKGDIVKITFKDIDSSHNLVIDGYDVSTDIIGKGKEDTIQFVADKVGSFKYYCSVSNHEKLGMTGTLVVDEK